MSGRLMWALAIIAVIGIDTVSPAGQEPAAATAKPGTTTSQGAELAQTSRHGDEEPLGLWTGGRYRITPSDVLELRFPYVPEFDQTVTVQPDGYISLRAVGDLRVQGYSVPEIQIRLAEAYQNVLRQPVINVVLKEFEKPYFIVAGEVAHPGKFELRGATTLTQGLVLAGGPTNAAKSSQVVLFRRFMSDWLEVKQLDVKKMYATRKLDEDPLLRPGDTIYVPKSTLAKIAPFIPRPGIGIYWSPFTPQD